MGRFRFVSAVLAAGLFWMGGSGSAVASPVLLPLDVSSPAVSRSVSLPYTWDDAWFGQDSYTYNHGMARIAGALMSTVYLQDTYRELTILFGDLGCDLETLADYHYAAVEPELPDKSGYSFCTKQIVLDGKPTALVFVVIRGTAGRQEWISNANISDSTHQQELYHEGFANSARLIARDLQAYAAAQGLGPDTRFLITGHSRGAAVANLLGAFLDTGSYTDGAKSPELVPGHLYVYAFASPNSCSDIAVREAALYRNIFNIVNPEDIVPQLPFIKGSWGYGSFGTTYLLPSANNLRGDPARYARLEERMQEPFGQLTQGRHYTPVPGSEWLARDVKGLQWAFVGSVSDFYGTSRMLNHAGFLKVLAGLPEGEDERADMYYGGILKFLAQKFPEERAGFEDVHAPATYNAWILSGEPSEIYMRGTPSLVRIQLPAAAADAESIARTNRIRTAMGQGYPDMPFDLELRVPGGEVVATLKNGVPEVFDGRTECAIRNDGQTVSFTVPEDGSIEAHIIARKDVQLHLTVSLEVNKENGVSLDAPLQDNKTLELSKGQQQAYVLQDRRLQPVTAQK